MGSSSEPYLNHDEGSKYGLSYRDYGALSLAGKLKAKRTYYAAKVADIDFLLADEDKLKYLEVLGKYDN